MYPIHPIVSSLMIAALCLTSLVSHAQDNQAKPVSHVAPHAAWAPPPPPPAPPEPPAPPAPPTLAELPMPPAPPAPPPMPAIPLAAHQACAGKAVGTEVLHVLRRGETMRGTCQRVGGKMVFELRSYSLEDNTASRRH